MALRAGLPDFVGFELEEDVKTDYDAIYRKLHPRRDRYSPYERQRELHDLWPRDQRKFREMVDAIQEPS